MLKKTQQNDSRVRLLLEIAKFLLQSIRWGIYGKTVEYGILNYVFVHGFRIFEHLCE